MAQVPIADRLFTWPSDDPGLLGSRCGDCSAVTFPVSAGCPRCGSDVLSDEVLPQTGAVWTWTTQGFLPKEPYIGDEQASGFTPWVVASVELAQTLRVEGRVVNVTAGDMRIGMPVRLVLVPITSDADGNEVITYAFTPVPEGHDA